MLASKTSPPVSGYAGASSVRLSAKKNSDCAPRDANWNMNEREHNANVNAERRRRHGQAGGLRHGPASTGPGQPRRPPHRPPTGAAARASFAAAAAGDETLLPRRSGGPPRPCLGSFIKLRPGPGENSINEPVWVFPREPSTHRRPF